MAADDAWTGRFLRTALWAIPLLAVVLLAVWGFVLPEPWTDLPAWMPTILVALGALLALFAAALGAGAAATVASAAVGILAYLVALAFAPLVGVAAPVPADPPAFYGSFGGLVALAAFVALVVLAVRHRLA